MRTPQLQDDLRYIDTDGSEKELNEEEKEDELLTWLRFGNDSGWREEASRPAGNFPKIFFFVSSSRGIANNQNKTGRPESSQELVLALSKNFCYHRGFLWGIEVLERGKGKFYLG